MHPLSSPVAAFGLVVAGVLHRSRAKAATVDAAMLHEMGNRYPVDRRISSPLAIPVRLAWVAARHLKMPSTIVHFLRSRRYAQVACAWCRSYRSPLIME